MSEWQPIETAPRDGTQILVCFVPDMGRAIMVVEYDPDREGEGYPWVAAESAAYHKNAVTHWQPLPAPPTLAERERK